MTMNNTWGFKRNDQDWKSARTLARNLIDCASKGGNYLLNVGPTGSGSIPEPSSERLHQIGRWMKINGDAIYGSAASPFNQPLPWGRCTTKTNGAKTVLFLHVFDWPDDGDLLVPGLRNRPVAVRLLAAPDLALKTESGEDGLLINLPPTAPDSLSSTVALTIDGAPQLEPASIPQRRDGSVTLAASQARLHGSKLQYESGGPLDNLGYWTTPEDWAEWEFKLRRPGKFSVSATLAAPASGAFELSAAGQTLRCTAPSTGSYFAFQTIQLGQLDIPLAGKILLTVRPIKDGWQPMNLRAIRLEPLPSVGRTPQPASSREPSGR
jgi:alpha-L-fucosidase